MSHPQVSKPGKSQALSVPQNSYGEPITHVGFLFNRNTTCCKVNHLDYLIAAVAGKYLEVAASATLSLDLSQDWVNSTVVLHTAYKPPSAPKLSAPSMWYDEAKDIFYSGTIGRVSYFDFDTTKPSRLSLWSFKPDGLGSGTWKEEVPEGDPVWDDMVRTTYGYQASGRNLALVLGGMTTSLKSRGTENILVDTLEPGLITFDMTTRQFTNSTVKSFNANETGMLGQMHFVPFFGPNGLFLIMGGQNLSDFNYGFSEITVYEAETQKWYNQTTSGYPPEARRDFCVAGVNSTGGTYEIFLYGGDNGHLGAPAVPYDEIFILTLPAFHWLKVDYPPQSPRAGHTCNAIGGSQILSVGGFDANPKIAWGEYEDIRKSMFNTTADPFAQGLGIFDMTSLTWADHYTANAPQYVQSDLIKTFYRNNPGNGSQFSTNGLKDLFQTTHFTPADSESSPSSNPTTTSPPKSTHSSVDGGTIAGAVIGGVVGLAVIAGTFFYFWRRMKRRTSTREDPHPGNNATPTIPEPRAPSHSLQEADANSLYKGAQLEGRVFHEMQQQPAEMAAYDRSRQRRDQSARYEMDAAQK
ncbi:MAG: hypothetical protein Q9209_000024 [Squamulea sp. 1 TL-2023]